MKAESGRRPGALRGAVILGVAGVCAAGGAFLAWRLLAHRGQTDVGGLAALASVQAQLRTVDACRIEYDYNTPGRYRERYRRIVFITPCGKPEIFPWKGRVNLSAEWAHEGLAFEAVRSSVADDWSILVDQERVPFPILVAGLGELTPIVVREAAGALAQARAEEAAGSAAYEENQRRLKQERERSQGSYPPH